MGAIFRSVHSSVEEIIEKDGLSTSANEQEGAVCGGGGCEILKK